jgi:hypothetical protein
MNSVTQMQLYYAINGAATWNLINSLNGSPENFNWVVPMVKSRKKTYIVK